MNFSICHSESKASQSQHFSLCSMGLRSTTGGPSASNYLALIFTIIVTVDILRNIISSLSHTQFAVGNVIGNIFGLFVFYGAISVVSPESANSSLFWTIVMFVSLIVGILLTLWKVKSEQGSYY